MMPSPSVSVGSYTEIAEGSTVGVAVVVTVEVIGAATQHGSYLVFQTDIELRVDTVSQAYANIQGTCNIIIPSVRHRIRASNVFILGLKFVDAETGKNIEGNFAVWFVEAEVVHRSYQLGGTGEPSHVRGAFRGNVSIFIAGLSVQSADTNRENVIQRFAHMQATPETNFAVEVAKHERKSGVNAQFPLVSWREGTVSATGRCRSILGRKAESCRNKENS